MVSTYQFYSNKSYSFKIDFYGFEDEDPSEIIGSSETLGTFEVKRDSVFMKGKEITSWEKGFNPNPETIQLNREVYGNRFEIIEETLTLYYISYPADAPVQTQVSYKKENK